MSTISTFEAQFDFQDDPWIYRQQVVRTANTPFIRICLGVFMIHVAALYIVDIDVPVYVVPDLNIVLDVVLSKEVSALEEVLEIPGTEPTQESLSKSEIPKITESVVVESGADAGLRFPTVNPGASIASPLKYHLFSEIIRKESNRKRREIKSFSIGDFPLKKTEPGYFRKEAIQKMVSAPRKIISSDARGYTTIKTEDGFGNVTCMQERGFKGDANPPLWYLVPATTCGHLK